GTADGRITDGDAVIVFNFRSDRVREISRTFCDPHFTGFAQRYRPQLCRYVCFTEYDETLHLPVAFPPENLHNLLAEVVASAGLRQLHIAETEKYAHVTFFFNGGREEPFRGEERILIPSPQDVTTYDKKPQMSAAQVRDTVCGKIAENCFDLIILNFANPDMVGHTGSLPAAVKAMETVDRCLADVVAVTLQQGGALLITADHGNCEQMIDDQGQPHTAHTTNPVALLYVAGDSYEYRLADGRLADLAPTLLQLLHLPQPAEMTGHSLLQPA
ncbi:MAG: 2,3-bisphosphoglycerate-independent phosphoglycerate mutase, partial [Desulfuromonas sp.]